MVGGHDTTVMCHRRNIQNELKTHVSKEGSSAMHMTVSVCEREEKKKRAHA